MSISAASIVLTLSQPILFPSPQQIQGFATDDVTDIEPVKVLESMMGVDGFLSFGFVWAERNQTIVLQADSASNTFFDVINTQQEAVQDVYPLNGTMIIPSIGMKLTFTNGGMETYKPMPQAKKVLQRREYRITWNRVVPSPA